MEQASLAASNHRAGFREWLPLQSRRGPDGHLGVRHHEKLTRWLALLAERRNRANILPL